jgi:hypothetical protein
MRRPAHAVALVVLTQGLVAGHPGRVGVAAGMIRNRRSRGSMARPPWYKKAIEKTLLGE